MSLNVSIILMSIGCLEFGCRICLISTNVFIFELVYFIQRAVDLLTQIAMAFDE